MIQGKGGDFASLFTDKLAYLGRDEVNQYVVYSTKMLTKNNNDQLEIEVKMGRNLLTLILTTFVPTVLLNMISYATTFFKPFFFEATVTVNLTSMLVLTTLFINVRFYILTNNLFAFCLKNIFSKVSNSLPPTSYIKMIDVYLIFSLLIPFVEVLLQTYMDSLRM